MPTRRRQMALTPVLIAPVARVVEDAGPSPGAGYLTEEDYEVAVRNILAQAPSGDVWLFGYGSLLWKPAFEYVESRMGSGIPSLVLHQGRPLSWHPGPARPYDGVGPRRPMQGHGLPHLR